MLAVQTILHPTDFSERASAAFELASAIARDYGARLILLNVAVPPKADRTRPDPARLEEYQRSLEERRRWLRAGPSSPIPTEILLKEGDPAVQILAAAAESNVDLIVMGAHGRTSEGRFLMGSVAEAVGRRANCPVLTVRDPFPRPVPSRGTRESEALATVK